MSSVTLRKIISCTLSQQKAVREIRNQYGVRRSMYTDHEIGMDEHLAWISRLENDDRQIVFIVLINDTVSGVVSLNAIDKIHKKSDWAFYLDENVRGGLGAALEFKLLDFAFNELTLEKLNCEVIESNEAVVKMHKKFGFVEEGFRRSNIEKDGERIGVYFLGITQKEWSMSREQVHSKYKTIMSKFSITVEYADD